MTNNLGIEVEKKCLKISYPVLWSCVAGIVGIIGSFMVAAYQFGEMKNGIAYQLADTRNRIERGFEDVNRRMDTFDEYKKGIEEYKKKTSRVVNDMVMNCCTLDEQKAVFEKSWRPLP